MNFTQMFKRGKNPYFDGSCAIIQVACLSNKDYALL